MTQRRRLLALGLALALPALLGAQRPAGRWEILLQGPGTSRESGEIRFEGPGARILLERADSAFFPVSALRTDSGRISFDVTPLALHFDGAWHDSVMSGTMTGDDTMTLPWQSWPLPAGLEKWPVRPRLVINQLLLGREEHVLVIPADWVRAMPPRATLRTAFEIQMRNAGLVVGSGTEGDDADRMALGFDPAARQAARRLLDQIASGPAANAAFTEIFGSAAHRRLDLHDRALEVARTSFATFRLEALARGLATITGRPVAAGDTLVVLGAAWSLWSELRGDRARVLGEIERLRTTDPSGANSVSAIFDGYDTARIWWSSAMQWMLTAPWLETAAGRRSPAQLVAAFWGRDSLPLPVLTPTSFGGYEARAVAGIAPIASRMVRPGNAVAAEWIARRGAVNALTAWRRVDAAGDMLQVDFGTVTRRLTSPMAWARSHDDIVLPASDVVLIDPGIVPVLAVATVVHEWQHLLFAAARMAQLDARASGIRLQEESPWLSEGAAEWATETILARGGTTTALLRALEANKRYILERNGGDDPHPTGYRLVLAVAASGKAAIPVLRQRLAALMHDPAAFARASGFGRSAGAGALRLESPVDAVVIPEISFTWDSDYADSIRPRLVVPSLRPEH